MKLQVLHDSDGNNSGVYIPAQEWDLIKKQYPDIEEITEDIPDWQKEILSSRIEAIYKNPERVKPIKGLFDTLDKKVKK
ncbi:MULTISPECIES: addiction module component CHP02574 family protein [Flavobacterium]|uniref:addiction module component CHP02574 family protein n=1 Tax=Flavobacterium TaxID=237 RepID=UPI00188B886B|nr:MULTISPECIES: addiction module component CHP02574 family protein [Flavobacterium]MBF4472681.1 addiction module component CHP02574 family protein [Flavobacterium sp. HJJ]